MSIQRLMHRDPADWALCDLRESLQRAIELEFSTIPLYLCAMWSIKDPGHEVAQTFRDIVIQEMLHMGIACNLLTTIGGTPQIASPAAVPEYPGHLPGGGRPDLSVYLQGLTRQTLREIFMEIEFPESTSVDLTLPQTGFTSIGEFYDAVLDAFLSSGVALTGDRQRTSDNYYLQELQPIISLADVEAAITLIKDQGEGTSMSPEDLEPGDELAHYYRFSEIYRGMKLVQDGSGQWQYDATAPIAFPAVYPVARIPVGGYPSTIAEVAEFDQGYTDVLYALDQAWATPDDNLGQTLLGNAITAMYRLSTPALALMTKQLDGGDFTYGPCFRFLGC